MNYEPSIPPPPPPPHRPRPPQQYINHYGQQNWIDPSTIVDPHPRALAERGTATAPFVLGVIAAVLGWIPLLCVVTVILALIGLPLGVIAIRRRQRLAWAATTLCTAGLIMSILGFVVMGQIGNDLDSYGNCIDNANTLEELDAC